MVCVSKKRKEKECVIWYVQSNQWITDSTCVWAYQTGTALVSISIWCCILDSKWFKAKHSYQSQINVNRCSALCCLKANGVFFFFGFSRLIELYFYINLFICRHIHTFHSVCMCCFINMIVIVVTQFSTTIRNRLKSNSLVPIDNPVY